MADLSLDEIALKDRFLERNNRASWTAEDYKSAAFDHNIRVDRIVREISLLGHQEALTHENLTRLAASLGAFLQKVNVEVDARKMVVAGFSVMAAHPVKRFSFNLVNYLLALLAGAGATYFIITHGVGI